MPIGLVLSGYQGSLPFNEPNDRAIEPKTKPECTSEIMNKKPSIITILYSLLGAASFVLALCSYKELCPADSNKCFRTFAANATIFVAGIGFILMYLSKAFFGKLGESKSASQINAKWLIARVSHVAGSAIALSAASWFFGCITASLI
jgi:hypothetical protein